LFTIDNFYIRFNDKFKLKVHIKLNKDDASTIFLEQYYCSNFDVPLIIFYIATFNKLINQMQKVILW